MANKYADASIESILAGCVDEDDERAWLVLQPHIERIGRLYIRKLTNIRWGVDGEEFPTWLCSELFKRRARARARNRRSDLLAHILDCIREHRIPEDEQEAYLGRRLGAKIKKWLGPDFVDRTGRRQGQRRRTVLVGEFPESKQPIAPSPIEVRRVEDRGQAVECFLQAVTPLSLPLVYLRMFHFVGVLPPDVVEHVMACQATVAGNQRVIPLDTGDDEGALLEFLRAQDLDHHDCIRWEPLSALLNLPKGTLMTRWSRVKARIEAIQRQGDTDVA